MRSTDSTKFKKISSKIKKIGGEELMFGNELIIGSIRAQSESLRKILTQLESDEDWLNNNTYYSKELRDVERRLRTIRRRNFESINVSEVCGV